MEKIIFHPFAPPVSTELYFGEGVLSALNPDGKKFLIADQGLKELYATDLAKRIGAELLTIPSGERAKSQETAIHLMEQLFQLGADRESTLIGLGGGAATDLIGFVASIYMRGLPLILIPTTLLGAVDAVIGGKTAIDTSFGKNLIGTLYHPQAIFIDLNLFQTLPEKERLNGMAEILKMGLIYDRSLWAKESSPALILKAIRAKISIIEQDAKDHSLRRILNFGHTIAHALETVSGYAMDHGEAVALGSLVESHLSRTLGYLSDNDFNEIERVLSCFPLKLPKNYSRSKLFEAMKHDKKRGGGAPRFVLIDRIGHAIAFDGAYCRPVSPSELEPSLDWMEGQWSK